MVLPVFFSSFLSFQRESAGNAQAADRLRRGDGKAPGASENGAVPAAALADVGAKKKGKGRRRKVRAPREESPVLSRGPATLPGSVPSQAQTWAEVVGQKKRKRVWGEPPKAPQKLPSESGWGVFSPLSNKKAKPSGVAILNAPSGQAEKKKNRKK